MFICILRFHLQLSKACFWFPSTAVRKATNVKLVFIFSMLDIYLCMYVGLSANFDS